MRRVIGVAINVALITALAFVVFLAYGLIGNRWYHIIAIEGGSMEPTITRGDLIIVTPPPSKVEPGMILVMTVGDTVITHRVVAVNADGTFETRGDANNANDAWGDRPVVVQAQYVATIPWLGHILPVRNASGASFAARTDGTQRIQVGTWPDPTHHPGPTPTPTHDGFVGADVRIVPFTVNLSSHGHVTAFVYDLAGRHRLSEIDRWSIRLCYGDACIASTGKARVDGLGHVAANFDRSALEALLGPDRGCLTLTVQGQLVGGGTFSGHDAIHAIGGSSSHGTSDGAGASDPDAVAEPTPGDAETASPSPPAGDPPTPTPTPTVEPTAAPTPEPTTTPEPTPAPTAEPTPEPIEAPASSPVP